MTRAACDLSARLMPLYLAGRSGIIVLMAPPYWKGLDHSFACEKWVVCGRVGRGGVLVKGLGEAVKEAASLICTAVQDLDIEDVAELGLVQVE